MTLVMGGCQHLIRLANLERDKTIAENNLLRAEKALLEERLNEPTK